MTFVVAYFPFCCCPHFCNEKTFPIPNSAFLSFCKLCVFLSSVHSRLRSSLSNLALCLFQLFVSSLNTVSVWLTSVALLRFLLFKTSQEAMIVVLRSSNYKDHSFRDLMKDIEMTPILELRPYIKAEKIKARVCRIWQSTILGTTKKYTSLHCILLDGTVNFTLCDEQYWLLTFPF
nr:uncharacterized protein LOC103411616 [Malus domestica]